jgi:two-component system, NtrC family, sensor kinase
MQEDKMASIGQLSAGIAHEINNPLGFVLSNFNTLKKYTNKIEEVIKVHEELKEQLNRDYKGTLAEEVATINSLEKSNKIEYILGDLPELFKDTEEGLERIRNIVIALRNFSHENINGEHEEYDLNDGIRNALVIARNEIKYSSEVITNLGDIPLIHACSSEINQVILNIIVNASQAIKMKMEKDNISNKKYGQIVITTCHDASNVFFYVEDNGIGIAEKYLSKVFEPFFTTKPIGKGTGLGLSISYEIIKNKHNGDIIINSIADEGTKILIKLPI